MSKRCQKGVKYTGFILFHLGTLLAEPVGTAPHVHDVRLCVKDADLVWNHPNLCECIWLHNIRHDSGNIRRDSGNIRHDSGNIRRDSGNIRRAYVGQLNSFTQLNSSAPHQSCYPPSACGLLELVLRPNLSILAPGYLGTPPKGTWRTCRKRQEFCLLRKRITSQAIHFKVYMLEALAVIAYCLY